MRLADQITNRALVLAEAQHRRSGIAIAHLVQQARQRHIVARADTAIGLDQELGHQKQ
ncbi:hypothetical protein D3C86_1827550 [compost metagenome]